MDANSHERNLTDAVSAVMKERTEGTWVMNDQASNILLVLTEGCCFREALFSLFSDITESLLTLMLRLKCSNNL